MLMLMFSIGACKFEVKDQIKSTAEDPLWNPLPLLPGTPVFDVTKEPFNAIPNDTIDDTDAIQAAINEAAVIHRYAEDNMMTLQQIIYIPAGTYLISNTLACRLNRVNPAHAEFEVKASEAYQWIKGDGAGKTILRLLSSDKMGEFGTNETPRPVLQTAQYTYERRQSGNIKFQLWVTDLSIIVPDDQPNAVGLSYGVANMGAVRRVVIRAEGAGGHTGLALVQNNNGPGLIEKVRIEGFSTGIEVNDPSGKNFYLKDIEILNQKSGGAGLSVSDKVIGIENMVLNQRHSDVRGVVLRNTKSETSTTGGMAHLTLLNPHFHYNSKKEASVPVIHIEQGHLYMRGGQFYRCGTFPILDHGKFRSASSDEIVLVHGHSKEEKTNVVVAFEGAPTQSLNLPQKSTPVISPVAWELLKAGDYTTVSMKDLKRGSIVTDSSWIIVKPSGTGDDTHLLQAAFNSGARYIGLLNGKAFVIKRTLFVNAPGTPGNVELIFGHMTDILIKGPVVRQFPYRRPNYFIGFHLNTGRHPELFIRGIRLEGVVPKGANPGVEDFQLFQNDARSTVVFKDVRAKTGPRAYRNGFEAENQEVYFDNVEFAYSGGFPQEMVVFKNQKVWARNFNIEMPVSDREYILPDKTETLQYYLSASTVPRMVNDGGMLFTIGQKVGEHSGPFLQTQGGGKTELLSFFINQKTSRYMEPTTEASILRMEGKGSACSLVGAERTRNQEYPHQNSFIRIRTLEGEKVVACTEFPTHRKYIGYDPFEDNDNDRYLMELNHRVFGLFRAGN